MEGEVVALALLLLFDFIQRIDTLQKKNIKTKKSFFWLTCWWGSWNSQRFIYLFIFQLFNFWSTQTNKKKQNKKNKQTKQTKKKKKKKQTNKTNKQKIVHSNKFGFTICDSQNWRILFAKFFICDHIANVGETQGHDFVCVLFTFQHCGLIYNSINKIPCIFATKKKNVSKENLEVNKSLGKNFRISLPQLGVICDQ